MSVSGAATAARCAWCQPVHSVSQLWLCQHWRVDSSFYSDRTSSPKPRDVERVTQAAWRGLIALIESKIESSWLAREFPKPCPDGNGVAGTDQQNLFDMLSALVGIEWPPYRGEEPDTAMALDLVDFVAQRVAKPVQTEWHSYWKHHDLDFEVQQGRNEFREAVNLIFRRTGVAFELTEDMRTARLGPPETRQVIADLRPATGDAILDELLANARRRYLSRDVGEERLGLEKLWDAFERLKTIEPGPDKKAQ
jgi:hypothetical protein